MRFFHRHVLYFCLISLFLLSCGKRQEAPSFSLPELGSQKRVHLSDFSGKTRLIVFWATWCVPCISEIPILNELQKTFQAQGLQVIGVNVDEERTDEFVQIVQKMGIQYPVVLGNRKIVADYGNFQAVPQSFLVDREGLIVKQYEGAISKDSLLIDILAAIGTGKSTFAGY